MKKLNKGDWFVVVEIGLGVILIIMMIFSLYGCDSRIDNDVRLEFDISSSYCNGVGEEVLVDTTAYKLNINLYGNKNFISNKEIHIQYDEALFTLTGDTNEDDYLITHNDGRSVGELNIRRGVEINWSNPPKVIANYNEQSIERTLYLIIN